MEIIVLGGGISGISAGYHINSDLHNTTIYEARKSWGGLLDNFKIPGGFTFDRFIHLSFTENEYVKGLFDKSVKSISHKPISYNLSNGNWLKHPAQFNLAPLPIVEKFNIIKSFILRNPNSEIKSYYDWLVKNYGDYFAVNYSNKYTRKYWTVDSKLLTSSWLSTRFKVPGLYEVLKGSIKTQNDNHYYAKEMRYPKNGSYKNYLNYMVDNSKIELNKKAVLIDPKNKKVEFSDNSFKHYDKIISSIPLPEIIKIIKDVPRKVLESSKKLVATSGQLVSIGFKKNIDKHLWYYIYDEEFLPSRAWSPSLKSPNNAPPNKSSIQFETYFSSYKPKTLNGDDLKEHIIKKSKENNLFNPNEIESIDYREVKYANIIFDHHRKNNLKIVHDYLKSINIEFIGRFGEWDYLWSDQCVFSGRKVANKINNL